METRISKLPGIFLMIFLGSILLLLSPYLGWDLALIAIFFFGLVMFFMR
jgi:hypothetical protein